MSILHDFDLRGLDEVLRDVAAGAAERDGEAGPRLSRGGA